MFARVQGGKVRLHLPVGAADAAVLDAGSRGIVLSGIASREDVPLFAAASFAMNGVVLPGSTTPLRWKEGFDGSVSVTMVTPKNILVTRPPLTAKRPCSDLSLDSGARLAPAKAALGREYGQLKVVRAGRVLEIFADPGHPADAKLILADDLLVQAFDSSGAFSRIGGSFGEVFIAGWVRSGQLKDTSGGGGQLGVGYGRTRVVSGVLRTLRRVACPADMPLVAEADGERATVGIVLSGTSIDVVDEAEPLSQIQTLEREIQPHVSSRFLVPTSDLRACRTQ